jgi:hypothetical protein
MSFFNTSFCCGVDGIVFVYHTTPSVIEIIHFVNHDVVNMYCSPYFPSLSMLSLPPFLFVREGNISKILPPTPQFVLGRWLSPNVTEMEGNMEKENMKEVRW